MTNKAPKNASKSISQKTNTKGKAVAKKPVKSKLIKKLDVVFSEYIRKKDSANGKAKCVTCGKVDEWKKMQAGHFMSRTKYATRWDEENVQVQCVRCNRFSQGEQYLFSLYLGADKAKELYEKSLTSWSQSIEQLQKTIEHYVSLNKKME